MTADFAATIAAFLPEARALAEANMVDACSITRAGASKGTFNNATGKYDNPSAASTIYTGKCRVQVTSITVGATDSNAGDRVAVVQASELQLPIAGTDTVAINDVVTITAALNDPALVGRKFTVAARHEKSQATSRRLRVEEVTG